VFGKKVVSEEFNGYLGQGTIVTGDLCYSGTLHLEGSVRGSITTTDVLIVGPLATVEAHIKAGEVQISGNVTGDGGPLGPAGPRGPQGPPGSPNYRTTWSAYTDMGSLEDVTVIAMCPAGTKVAGGGHIVDENTYVMVSEPTSDFSGWRIIARAGLVGGHVEAIGVCGLP